MKKIKYFNRTEVKGVVSNFTIKEFTKCKIGEITIKSLIDGNTTRVVMFERKGMMFGGKSYDELKDLQSVFMDSSDKPKNILVSAYGRVSETSGKNSSGQQTTYTNIQIYKLEENDDETKQYAILKATGIVDSKAVKELDDGGQIVRVKIGMVSTNKDEDITGVDYVTLVAHGKNAEKLADIEKGSNVSLFADFINVATDVDRFGSGSGYTRENRIAKVGTCVEVDELDETDFENYKKAKKLERGQILKLKKEEEEDSFDEFDDWGE